MATGIKMMKLLTIILICFFQTNVMAAGLNKKSREIIINKAIAEVSRNLPLKIDFMTTVNSLIYISRSNEIRYMYQLTDEYKKYTTDEISKKEYWKMIDNSLKNMYCTTPDMTMWRDEFKIKLIYNYYSEDGMFLHKTKLDPKVDCN